MARPNKSKFQNSIAKLLLITFLLVLVPFETGCPEAGEGVAEGVGEGMRAGGGVAIPEAARGASEGVGAEAIRGAGRASEGIRGEGVDGVEAGEAGEIAGEALRAAEGTTEGASHFYARINEDGLIYTIDEIGFRDEIIGRFNEEGELWALRGNQPVRMIARIDENGNLWEVNSLGNTTRVIGGIRATITGSTIIEMYSGPNLQYSTLRALREGDVVEVIGRNQDWLQVRTANGDEGWILSSVIFQGVNSSDGEHKEESGSGCNQ